MNNHLKTASVIMAAALFAGFQEPATLHYYSLKFLKSAASPRAVTMIINDNSTGKCSVSKKGVLFTYDNRSARKVEIAGSFSSWKPVSMQRGINGIWYYFLYEYKTGSPVRYKYQCDGLWLYDPENFSREDDGYGSYLSVSETFFSIDGKRVTYRIINENQVEFRIYHPSAVYVSIAGDFNNWNPESDRLIQGADGIWRLKKRIPRGRYRYNYVVDGKWLPDLYNEDSASNQAGEICSLLEKK